MKKLRLLLAVLIGTAFFMPASMAIFPESVPVVHADNVAVNNVENAHDEQKSGKEITKDEIKKNISHNDIDWINKNILKNFKTWNESGGITDFSLNTAHTLSDIFMSVNLYMIYPIFDVSLSKMFDLANITKGINDILSNVQAFTKQTWAGEVFKQLLYLAFGVGVVWAFIKSVTSGGGMKAILSVLLVAILGGAWIGAGGTVLTTVNNFTSQAQTVIFTETTSAGNQYSGTDNFKDKIRKSYFEKAVVRPYMLVNFGKTNLADGEKQGSYRLIAGGISSDNFGEIAKNNDYLKKDGGYEWYQVAVSAMSPLMSLAYGIPLLMIGLFNLILQLGAILLYYLAPFTVLLSLIPKFANSALKTALGAVGLLFGKVGLLFAIMFVSWIGSITDTIIPVVSSATALLNSVVYFLLMYLLWKNKSFLVQTISGSSLANQALNKVSLTRAGQKAFSAGSEMVDSTRNGINSVKGLTGKMRGKGHGEADDSDEKPDNSGYDDMSVYQDGFKAGYEQGQQGQEPDDEEVKHTEEQRKHSRSDTLKDKFSDESDNDGDAQTRRRSGSVTDNDDLPKYRRRDYLLGHGGQSGQADSEALKDNQEALERLRHNRSGENEDTSRMVEKRKQARSNELHKDSVLHDKSNYPETGKTSGRNLDEVFEQQADMKARDKTELDKEL
ncbi:CD3337/EF1877 family mobilome membrane protein [Leuconostoc citreum]